MGEADFYTVDEMAEKLKVTRQSIYNKIHAGRAGKSIPPYVKMGNLVRFRVSDYRDWYKKLQMNGV